MGSGKRRGFTVIELLVMIAVFATLSGVILANFAGNRASQNLRAAANQLAEDIRRAQTLTYSNSRQLICTDNLVCGSGSSCDPSMPSGCTIRYIFSYGVKFNSDGSGTKYAVFSDYATPGAYVAGEAIPSGERTLPKNIVIQSVTPIANDPIVYTFNNLNSSPFVTCSANCTTTITLRSTETNATRTVVVQKQTGAVSVP